MTADNIFWCLGALVVAVALLAWLPKPPWLDRLWLWLIGIAFVVYFPIFTILQVQRFGLANVLLTYLALFLFGMYRAWPTDSQTPPSIQNSN